MGSDPSSPQPSGRGVCPHCPILLCPFFICPQVVPASMVESASRYEKGSYCCSSCRTWCFSFHFRGRHELSDLFPELKTGCESGDAEGHYIPALEGNCRPDGDPLHRRYSIGNP